MEPAFHVPQTPKALILGRKETGFAKGLETNLFALSNRGDVTILIGTFPGRLDK